MMRTDMCRRGSGLRTWHLMVLFVLIATSMWGGAVSRTWAQTPVPATLVQAATPMLPYMDWLIDPSGTLTVDDMAAPAQQSAFRPLNLEKVPRESGTVWMRFTLAPRVVDARPSTYLLDMGEGVPGTPTLYLPKQNVLTNTTTWQDFTPSQRSIFLMPDAQTSPVTAYIKMAGMPGLWFAPMLRTPHNAATALERLLRPAVIVVLGVVMLLCLLRGLAERGEWRFWTSLYTGAALLHSVWGVPTLLQGAVPMDEIAAVLAPGVALMLLPHVGRHLMHTREKARIIDVQYLLLALPGAALALIPLIPGFSWTIRYLDLWPLGTLLLVPTTLGAWLMGLSGARRFLLGCLLPPLATALGLMGIGSTFPPALLATAPLWGVALSALIIAGTAATYGAEEGEAASHKDDPLRDPALRIVSPEELAQEANEPLPEPVMWEKGVPPRMPSDSVALAWEEKLRGPMDNLLREGLALGSCSLPPVARQHAQNLQDTVRGMLTLLSQPLDGHEAGAAGDGAEHEHFDLQQLLRDAHDSVATSAENKNIALSWFMPPHLPNRFVGDGQRLALCIRLLLESAVRATSRGGVQVAVRRVPESVDAGHLLFSVTDTGAGMPPHDRSSMAVARAWELAAVYRGFLGVECSPHGTSVSFSVRLLPATAVLTPPAEQATVASQGAPDADSTPALYSEAPWQQPEGDFSPAEAAEAAEAAAAATSNTTSVDGNDLPEGMPAAGSVSSAAHMGAEARADKATTNAPVQASSPRIIIADDSLSNRQLLAFFLEGLPYSTAEARSPDEAVELYTASPAALIIFDGDMPEDDTLNAVARVRAFEAEYSLPQALVLALTTDDSRWEVLHYGGFTHALVKPVSRTGLRRTVEELLPAGTIVVPPLPMGVSAVPNPLDMGSGMDAHAGPAPFSIPADEQARQDEAATRSAWLDEDLNTPPSTVQAEEEIFDTGEPIAESAPLRMGPDDTAPRPAAEAAQNKGGGMPLPMMDTVPTKPAQAQPAPRVKSAPVPEPVSQPLPEAQAAQVMPELAPIAPLTLVDSIADANTRPHAASQADMLNVAPENTGASTADSAPSASENMDADMEDIYPYPSHNAASTPEAGAEQPYVRRTVAVLDAPSTSIPEDGADQPYVRRTHAAPESPTPATAAQNTATTVKEHATPHAASVVVSADDSDAPVQQPISIESLEWVGEPMPVGTVPSSQPTAASARASASAIPAWMRDSVAARMDPSASRAPSSATEWVGEPMPIPKAAPAVTPEPAATAPDSVGTPEPLAVPEPHGSSADVSAAAQPVLAPAAAGSDAEPSRIEDLLTPYTAASLLAQDSDVEADANALLADGAPAPEAAPAVLNRPSFIPLNFDPKPVQPAPSVPKPVVPAPAASVPAPAASVPAPAVPAASTNSSEADIPPSPPISAPTSQTEVRDSNHAKVDRLSLIPTESSLMDFIISSPAEPQPEQAPQAAARPAPVVSAVVSAPIPASKSVTITAGPAQRRTKATVTLARSPAPAPAESHPVAVAAPAAAPVVQATVVSVPAANTAPKVTVHATAAPTATAQPAATAQTTVPTAPVQSTSATATAPTAPSTMASVASQPDSPIPTMLKEFDEAMTYARGGFARKNIQAVQDSAVYIANRSETCGLRVLARMARCVGEAAKAGDVEALNNLLPELETAVERNKIALMKK